MTGVFPRNPSHVTIGSDYNLEKILYFWDRLHHTTEVSLLGFSKKKTVSTPWNNRNNAFSRENVFSAQFLRISVLSSGTSYFYAIWIDRKLSVRSHNRNRYICPQTWECCGWLVDVIIAIVFLFVGRFHKTTFFAYLRSSTNSRPW